MQLKAADAEETPLERRFAGTVALAAFTGAIRVAYRGAIIEEDNIAKAIVEANALGRYDETDAMLEEVFRLVRECPNSLNEQVSLAFWLIAPKQTQLMRSDGG